MQVKIVNDRHGYVLQPTNKRAQEAIAKHLEQWGITGPYSYQFWIENYQIEEYAGMLKLTQSDLVDLSHGWDITKNNVDSWEFLHVYGYDAHESVNW